MKGPDDITGADIDAYEEFLEKIREVALGPEPEPEPDPENPAVMKTPERRGSFKAVHIHRIRDEILARTIAAWSYSLPLPYEPGHRASIPGTACRMLEKAADPAGKLLNNSEDEDDGGAADPKPESPPSTASGGSAATLPASTASPLPESPPA